MTLSNSSISLSGSKVFKLYNLNTSTKIRMANKPQAEEKGILELVQWIDNNKSKVIKFYDALGGMGRTLVIVLVVLFFLSEVVNLTISDFAVNISIH
jgi:hypothetical protein